MGLVHNGGGLIAARFFLGVAEAGLFPGVNVSPAQMYYNYALTTIVLSIMLV
jgi:hypothetical protein